MTTPYTDTQVFERIRSVSATLKEITLDPAVFKKRVYVVGGVIHGRFGANSDIDIFFETTEEAWFKPGFTKNVSCDLSPFWGERQAKKSLLKRYKNAAVVSIREINANQDFLKSIYLIGLAKRGITVEFGADGAIQARRIKQVMDLWERPF